MELHLRYMPDQAIIWAEVTGEVTLPLVQQAATDGWKLAQEHHCGKYLIDISRVIFKYSFLDAIFFIEGLTKMGFSRQDRVAFVMAQGETIQKFWKLAAFNRGWSRLAYFTDPREAEKWLVAGHS